MAKKNYVHNVILVMSGGIGERFGADCPKQYSVMDNRLVIDYVIDACRNTKDVDQIVIVAAENYVEFCHKRYDLPTVAGGPTRPDSVANGLKYIYENYDCDKLIITNAVCPLATSEQYDRYFNFLDEYDFVLTTWKLAPALHRFDEVKVDRDDFFNIMEPDAYRFKILYKNFNFENKHKYIFHNMPDDSKRFYCFDYPYTTKLTYSHDLKVLKVLYDEIVKKPQKAKTLRSVNLYLSQDNDLNIGNWIENVQHSFQEFIHRYQVTSFSINTQTQANIVYEAHSQLYGDIVVKFTPSEFRFHKEVLYYTHACKDIMAPFIDSDDRYNAIVLGMVKPGVHVRFSSANKELTDFFDRISETLIPVESLKGDTNVPTIMGEYKEFADISDAYTYEIDFRRAMYYKVKKVWDIYFENAPKFYLHSDLQKRNLLEADGKVLAIDPRGSIGPKEFEYVSVFVTELREYTEKLNKSLYDEIFAFFRRYTSDDELRAALFIFFVHKMNDYVFHKNDKFKLASWCKKCLIDLYFKDVDNPIDKDIMPKGLNKIS